MIIDGHLDLAFGVLEYQRDLEHKTPQEIRVLEHHLQPLDRGLCTTTLSEMRRGGVAVAFATIFAEPKVLWTKPNEINPNGYTTPDEAHAQGVQQLEVYEGWAARGAVRLIKSQADLTAHLTLWQSDQIPGLVILMEGADPIRSPDELGFWFDRGVRIIGTSWGRTRYAGGTEMPGGLTALGRELVAAIEHQKMILDISHQSWEAFWDTLDIGISRMIASHSNAFKHRPTTNRHLTDAMLHEIAARDGRVGVVLFNAFLEARWSRENPEVQVTFSHQVRKHFEHMASILGWQRLGIGSDSDGGLGSLECPEGYDTIADLSKVADAVPLEHRAGVLGENWLRFLQQHLPK